MQSPSPGPRSLGNASNARRGRGHAPRPGRGSGGEPLRAWLLLRYADGFSCDDVMPQLEALPQVQACHSVAGETDMLVLVQADAPSMLSDLRETIAAFKGIDDVTTLPVLRTLLER